MPDFQLLIDGKMVPGAGSLDVINPATEGSRLTAKASEVSLRGRSGIYDVVITDAAETTIALFRGRTRQVGNVIFEETS